MLRRLLATVVPNPTVFRLSLIGGWLGRPFQRFMPGRLKGMVGMAPAKLAKASPVDKPQVFPAEGKRRMRVALLSGCAQPVLRPEINEATVRLLTRHGCEVVVAKGAGCCGAVVHHMGHEKASRAAARANVAAWTRELNRSGLDAVVFNASGCGVSLKDYGHLLRDDPRWGRPAARISELSKDISEVLLKLGLDKPTVATGQVVSYHIACSMQHGLGLRTQSKQLLSHAGFEVREPAESHICCGSAGTYSILQPELADRTPPAQGRATWRPPRRRSSPPATSAASPTSAAPRTCRWFTRWNCSTGRPAGQNRKRSGKRATATGSTPTPSPPTPSRRTADRAAPAGPRRQAKQGSLFHGNVPTIC